MTGHHVNYIKAYLKSKGFTDLELMDDLTDHLATEIEFSMDSEKLDFETSFKRAKQKLLPDSPYQLERDLKILTTPKHNIMIKKIAYLGGFLSIACFALAIMFYSLTTVSQKKSALKHASAQKEWQLKYGKPGGGIGDTWLKSDIKAEYDQFNNNLLITNYQRFVLAENLFIISFIILIVSYLPYQFYHRYQKSQLELTA
ncbi:hypothetical protein [Roseivirga thermotolerans]|uniref:hypothetical protein n=1 Tax=Roseivirga thermotolerans TaxID=1758176 RepID=UPI00273F178E|nr:hypothetical protein [Roseivirga thermotolerans]